MKKLIAGIAAVMILVCGCAAAFAGRQDPAREDVMKAVLDYSGLKPEEVTFTEVRLDHDDGFLSWEVELVHSGITYEFHVDVHTGRILTVDMCSFPEYDHDREFDLDDWFDFD